MVVRGDRLPGGRDRGSAQRFDGDREAQASASAAATTSVDVSDLREEPRGRARRGQDGLTPEAAESTFDGGSISLALADTRGVSWLVKLDRFGGPQWQEEVGCFNLPPDSFADGVSVQQTADGGYVVGGGTIGCGSSTVCPLLSGIQCALVERLDATGGLVWARVYSTGATSTAINRIRQTSDGGFIAVGSAQNDRIGALILKLDSSGNVQWQRQLGPAGTTSAYLNDVQQTADGAFVATGEFEMPSGDLPRTSVLVRQGRPERQRPLAAGFQQPGR